MSRPKSLTPLHSNVPVRLPPDIKAQLAREAEELGLPLSTYCRMLLVRHVKGGGDE